MEGKSIHLSQHGSQASLSNEQRRYGITGRVLNASIAQAQYAGQETETIRWRDVETCPARLYFPQLIDLCGHVRRVLILWGRINPVMFMKALKPTDQGYYRVTCEHFVRSQQMTDYGGGYRVVRPVQPELRDRHLNWEAVREFARLRKRSERQAVQS